MKYILIIMLLMLPTVVFAAGIQVSPEKLEFEVNDKIQTKEIIVANPTGDVQLFEVYPDDYERAIKANPESFTLEAGERKKVSITVESVNLSGIISTNLSIVGKPLADSRIQVNTGVKIPLSIKTSRSKYKKLIVPITVAVIVIAGSGSYYLFRKRKRLA